MEIPDTINNFLKPLVLTQPVDEKQLPANLLRQLRTIVSHFQNKAGNIVLFTGPSTSDNARAASLISKYLDRSLYRVDLAAVVSKYIGETEKNLLQVFEFAEKNDFNLLFDEADSLFGKRTKVDDAHDRYANLEISYLLRRIEAFSGMVILASNLRNNIDDALLQAARWQIDLTRPVVQTQLPLWRRFCSLFHKHR